MSRCVLYVFDFIISGLCAKKNETKKMLLEKHNFKSSIFKCINLNFIIYLWELLDIALTIYLFIKCQCENI